MKRFLSTTVYKDILNTVSDCIFIIDLKTQKVIFANGAANEFSEQILGKKITGRSTVKNLFSEYCVFHEEDRYSIDELLNKDSFGKFDTATRFLARSQTNHPKIRLRYQLFHEDETDKNSEYVYGVLSIRRIHRTELLRKNTQLFIKTIGHELKQPLGLIKAYTYYLERHFSKNASSADKYPKSINNQINIVVQMLNDIIDNSKISLQSLKIQPQETEVEEFVRSLVEDLQSADHHRQFHFSSQGKVQCALDRARMSQVITNLILNSMKYSEESAPITVTLSASRKWVTLSIQDEGVGIDPEEIPYIFEPYFRSAKNEKEGTRFGTWFGARERNCGTA